MMAGPAAAAGLGGAPPAGEWRAACGAEASDTSVVLEYAFTGGTAAVEKAAKDAAKKMGTKPAGAGDGQAAGAKTNP